MADRRGLAVLVRASARRARPDRLTGENIGKKRAARGCKRPKSREETPKEGGGNATTIAIPRCSNMPPRRTKGKSRFRLPFEGAAPWRNGHSPTLRLRAGPIAVADRTRLR